MKQHGFTLIELMVVIVIVAILATIAYPSYQAFIRRNDAAKAQQEIQRIATLLERHKARQFNYRGFSIPAEETVTPYGATGDDVKYTFILRDGDNTVLELTDGNAAGRSWMIQALSSDAQNFNYLLSSTGLRCRSTTAALVNFSCGSGSEPW